MKPGRISRKEAGVLLNVNDRRIGGASAIINSDSRGDPYLLEVKERRSDDLTRFSDFWDCGSFFTWFNILVLLMVALLILNLASIWLLAIYVKFWMIPDLLELVKANIAAALALFQNIVMLFVSKAFDEAGEAVGDICVAAEPYIEIFFPINCTVVGQGATAFFAKFENDITVLMHNVTQPGWDAALGSTEELSSFPYFREQLYYLKDFYPYENK